MLNRILKFRLCLLCAVSTLTPFHAMAQQCDAPFEMLTTLYHPDPGSYSVWSGAYGEPKTEEVLKSVLPREGGGAIAAGEVRATQKAKPQLVLVELDHRGRKKWSVSQKIDGLRDVVKMLPVETGYLVVANIENVAGQKNIWLGFFDGQGSLKHHVIFKDAKFGLSANDIIRAVNGKNFVMAVSREENIGTEKKKIMQNDAGVFILDTKGIKSSDRFFILGKGGGIKNLSSSTFGENERGYIATGWFENDYKKKIGWVVRLREDASLVWQREFERGLSASIEVSSAYNEQSILALGEVVPADSGSIGSWLMMLDAGSGNIKWQRYYKGETGAHDYKPEGLLVNADGLIFVAMQAKTDGHAKAQEGVKSAEIVSEEKAAEGAGMSGDLHIPDLMDYVHVLTLTPRGVTVAGDSYFEGKGVSLSQAVLGEHGERLMVGRMIAEDGEIAHLAQIEQALESSAAHDAAPQEVKPNLPQVDLPEKTLKGLALLERKISGKEAPQEQSDSADSKTEGAAEISDKDDGLSANGWVVMGTSADTYSDPCISKVKSLNSQ